MFQPCTQFPVTFDCLIGKSLFLAHRDFLIIAFYKYSYLLTYLLTKRFLVDNIYGSSINNAYEVNFLLEGLASC